MREAVVRWENRSVTASVVEGPVPVIAVKVKNGGTVTIAFSAEDGIDIPYSTASSLLWALTAAGVRHHMVAEYPT
jgi:hypothetical protein